MLPKQENYPLARQLALQSLADSDLRARAAKSGGSYESGAAGEARVRLAYLGQELSIAFPAGSITGAEPPVTLREEILILHYLERARGTPLAGEWISFADTPDGGFYHPVFLQRCKAPLLKFFSQTPEKLPAAAREMKGSALEIGDHSIQIRPFPFVPLALVLWRGDEDFPPEGNILFDGSIADYLSVEDIVTLTEIVVWKLVKRAAM